MKNSLKIALVIFAVLSSGCTDTKTETQPVATNAVEIKDFAFSPDSIIVTNGTTVQWTNRDSAPHTITIDKVLDSGTLNQGQTYSYTFNDAGTFEYICAIHPSMRAKVIVT